MEGIGSSLQAHLQRALDHLQEAGKGTNKAQARMNLLMAGAITDGVTKEIEMLLKVERNGRYV